MFKRKEVLWNRCLGKWENELAREDLAGELSASSEDLFDICGH